MQNITNQRHEATFLGQLLTADTEEAMLEMLKAVSPRQAVDLETVICGDPHFWPNDPEPGAEDADRAARRIAKHIINHRGQDPDEALDDLDHLDELDELEPA